MLREFEKVRQDSRGHRRLFISEKYELYLWYTDSSRQSLTGFQLVYFENDEQKAYTWRKDSGSNLTKVDGWDSNRFNRTPILVADGQADFRFLQGEMERELAELEPKVRELVRTELGNEIK